MKKNVFISNVFSETGIALAKAFRSNGYYIYGVDRKEDYDGLCDRALRFDLHLFVADASYRVRFTQIFDEIMPKLDALVFCSSDFQPAHLKDIQLDYWHTSLNTEVTAPMILAKLFQNRLENANGSILFMNEMAHFEDAIFDLAYITSNSARVGLMEAISIDMAGKVKVNAINTLLTVMRNEAIEVGYLEEVAEMAIYLASKNKIAVNGKVFIMDGGKGLFSHL